MGSECKLKAPSFWVCLWAGGRGRRAVNAQCLHECHHLPVNISTHVTHLIIIKSRGYTLILALPLLCCVTRGKWLHLSGPLFPCLQNDSSYFLGVLWRMCCNTHKTLSTVSEIYEIIKVSYSFHHQKRKGSEILSMRKSQDIPFYSTPWFPVSFLVSDAAPLGFLWDQRWSVTFLFSFSFFSNRGAITSFFLKKHFGCSTWHVGS